MAWWDDLRLLRDELHVRHECRFRQLGVIDKAAVLVGLAKLAVVAAIGPHDEVGVIEPQRQPLTGIISVFGSTSSGAPSSSQRRIVAISSSVRLQSWSNGTLSSLAGHGGMKRVSVTMAIAKAARDTSSAVSKRTCCVPGPSPVWAARASLGDDWVGCSMQTTPCRAALRRRRCQHLRGRGVGFGRRCRISRRLGVGRVSNLPSPSPLDFHRLSARHHHSLPLVRRPQQPPLETGMSRHPAPTIDGRLPDPWAKEGFDPVALIKPQDSCAWPKVPCGAAVTLCQALCQAQCDRSGDVEGERAEVAEIDTEVVAGHGNRSVG